MKYFSELTNKNYDTEDECKKAEAEFEDNKKKEETALAERKATISKRKKELSDSIKEADSNVDTAYKELEEAKKKAQEVIQEARKRANEIIRVASEKVDKEVSNRRDLITSFNKEFGPYMVTYTGDKAEEEYERIVRRMNDFASSVFSFSPFHWFF